MVKETPSVAEYVAPSGTTKVSIIVPPDIVLWPPKETPPTVTVRVVAEPDPDCPQITVIGFPVEFV